MRPPATLEECVARIERRQLVKKKSRLVFKKVACLIRGFVQGAKSGLWGAFQVTLGTLMIFGAVEIIGVTQAGTRPGEASLELLLFIGKVVLPAVGVIALVLGGAVLVLSPFTTWRQDHD